MGLKPSPAVHALGMGRIRLSFFIAIIDASGKPHPDVGIQPSARPDSNFYWLWEFALLDHRIDGGLPKAYGFLHLWQAQDL